MNKQTARNGACSKGDCFHQLFETQVARTPDAVAVRFRNEQLTYSELNRRANQLARRLRRLGVGPEVLVGICMDRSTEMVIGLLGILKSGGAYVSLDPNYPKERLAFILEDTHAPVVLTESKLLSRLPEMRSDRRSPSASPTMSLVHGPRSSLQERSPVSGPRSSSVPQRSVVCGPRSFSVICLDTDWEAISRENSDNVSHEIGLNSLACIIYIFGSTAKPHGVEVSHRGLVNFVCWAVDRYGLGPGDRVLQFAPIGLQAVIAEVFPCLTKGAELAIFSDDMIQSIPTFLKHCDDLQVTVLHLPTNYWDQITNEIEGRCFLPRSVGLVIISGDRALPERLKIWHKRVGTACRLVSTYGQTEATVVSTFCDLTAYPDSATTLGRPVFNVQAHILDDHLNAVPGGGAGELHIGGAGLARGYLNRPELTALKFIPNPFSTEPGARLYKTGDLAHHHANGSIELLGQTTPRTGVCCSTETFAIPSYDAGVTLPAPATLSSKDVSSAI